MAETLIQSLPWGLIFLVSDYVVVAVSLVIAYIAYRGYRRNDSRPMLSIAAGFALAFGGPGGIFLLSLVVPIPQIVVGLITQTTETAGMLLILYGFVSPAWR
jgi:hypothetical protein